MKCLHAIQDAIVLLFHSLNAELNYRSILYKVLYIMLEQMNIFFMNELQLICNRILFLSCYNVFP